MKLDFLILIILIRLIYNQENIYTEGVYQINSTLGLSLAVNIYDDMKLVFKKNFIKHIYFRLIPINNEQYYIESATLNKRISVRNNRFFFQKAI